MPNANKLLLPYAHQTSLLVRKEKLAHSFLAKTIGAMRRRSTAIQVLETRRKQPPASEEPRRLRGCIYPFIFLVVAIEIACALLNVDSILPLDHLPVQELFVPRRLQSHPRITFLGGSIFQATNERLVDDIWLGARQANYKSSDPVSILHGSVPLDETDTKCVPAADWQSRFYPVCNSFHEMGFRLKNTQSELQKNENTIQGGASSEFLGSGKSRDAWRVEKDNKAVVLKTLQVGGTFSHLAYYHQIVDAIASERLSPSPYVIDIFGFCGASVLNELGISHEVKEKFTLPEKLRYARDIAGGVADLHGIGGNNNAKLVHGDLRRGNVMFSLDRSTLKLSDFNLSFFLGWNSNQDEPCGHKRNTASRKRLRDKFSSPEETFGQVLTEKTDVYHLGGMIFYLLTGGKPFIYNNKGDLDEDGNPPMSGKWLLPILPKVLQNSDDPIVLTMWRAVQSCLRYNAKNRPTAKEIFLMLDRTVASSK